MGQKIVKNMREEFREAELDQVMAKIEDCSDQKMVKLKPRNAKKASKNIVLSPFDHQIDTIKSRMITEKREIKYFQCTEE